jgi:hypothetical protein
VSRIWLSCALFSYPSRFIAPIGLLADLPFGGRIPCWSLRYTAGADEQCLVYGNEARLQTALEIDHWIYNG